MKQIFIIIAFGLFLILGVMVIKEGISRNEVLECAKLARQSQNYPNFFYADWQKEMCNIK